MRKATLLFFLFFSLHASYAQQTLDSLIPEPLHDSTFDKYSHYGVSIGSSLYYNNFDELRSRSYMLGQPNNLLLLPIGSGLYLGNVHKYFFSLEYSFGWKSTKGEYTNGLNTYPNMSIDISHFRYGAYLYRSIYFKKNISFDINIGSSFSTTYISSRDYPNPQSSQIFANGKIKQISPYVGLMMRSFWPTRSCDIGINYKLGYNLPVTVSNWDKANFNGQALPDVDLGGPVVSISFYTWAYTKDYIIKHMKYPLYMYVPPPYVKDTTPSKPSPTDSTHSLFKNTAYSYIQWDLGFAAFNVNGELKNGTDMCLLGVVFNKKYFTSIGLFGFVETVQFNTTPPPKLDSYFGMYWNNEFLLHPDKIINFSFPLKIAYGAATGWDTIQAPSGNNIQTFFNWNFTGKNYYQHEERFTLISPGANIFVNLFKPISLGVGFNYRFALNVKDGFGNKEDLNNYTLLAFLRIKFDTRAMNKKAMERQKEFWKNK